jgi:hypothetical protein
MAAHGVDQEVGGIGFESGFEKGLACADGVDDGVLSGDSGFKKLRITRVAVENASAVHGLCRRVMHERGYHMAKFAGLLDESAAGFAIGTDDEEIHAGLQEIRIHLSGWMRMSPRAAEF